MEKYGFKLEVPEYDDEFVIELEGDYNDGDMVNDSLWVKPDVFTILLPILESLTEDYAWEDIDVDEYLAEYIEDNEIEIDSELLAKVNKALNNIHLYGDDGGCHTLYIEDIYFESKEDKVRYIVKK